MEDVDDPLDIDVVKESRDVKKNDGSYELAFDSRLGLVHEAQGRVRRAVVVA